MVKNQSGFHVLGLVIGLVVVAVITLAGVFVFSHGHIGHGRGSISAKDAATLPDINYFKTHKSDQFIVDMSLVQTGQPFKGQGAASPHNGAHAQFGDDYTDWPKGGTEPASYPSVYSPVDGYVYQVDSKFSDYSKQPVELYTIDIAFAKSGSQIWSLHYSLEPFVKEPSDGFYAKFIDVKVGQKVHKGDVIAHMYLDQAGGANEHIHFNLSNSSNGNFYAPAIFTPAVVQAFHDHWGSFGIDDIHNAVDGPKIPACMGYKLAANENPFGGAADCLN